MGVHGEIESLAATDMEASASFSATTASSIIYTEYTKSHYSEFLAGLSRTEPRKAEESELAFLADYVGSDSVNYIKSLGVKINFYSDDGKLPRYAMKFEHRVLLLYPFIHEMGLDEVAGSHHDKYLAVNFCREEEYEILLANSFSQQNTTLSSGIKPFDFVGVGLTPGTGKFLEFAGEVARRINADCEIVLTPTSMRRERMYRRFFIDQNINNVLIIPSGVDDLRGHSSSLAGMRAADLNSKGPIKLYY